MASRLPQKQRKAANQAPKRYAEQGKIVESQLLMKAQQARQWHGSKLRTQDEC